MSMLREATWSNLNTSYKQIIHNNNKIINNKLSFNHTQKICKDNTYQINEIENNIKILDTKAEILWKLGRVEEAIEIINECIQGNPEYQHYLEHLVGLGYLEFLGSL